MTSQVEARRLGAVLQCAPLEDPFEYRFLFDLTAVTFLQKLVPKRVMDRKLSFAPGESFRSAAVLAYASGVLGGGDALLDNLAVLAKELTKLARKATVPLGLVVTEIALYAAEHPEMTDEAAARQRYAPYDVRCACDPDGVDPYYEGMGFLLADLLPSPAPIGRVASKGQYLAAVFTGAFGGDAAADPFQASLAALRARAATATLAELEGYFRR